MIKNISVTILTKNSERHIRKCLESVKDFPEIIILDNGSSDNTIDICNEFDNVRVFKNEFIGFGPLKNLAASYAANDWILSLDSDEVLTYELMKEIKEIIPESQNVYFFKRLNFYKNKPVKCCGWYPDHVLRLYNRKSTCFNQNLVHESIVCDKLKKIRLNNWIEHYSYDSIYELMEKMQKYSELYAEENHNIKNSSPLKAVSRAIFCFIKNYFFRKGIFCGYRGFLISVFNSCNVFFKYLKLYEKNIFSKEK